MSGETQRQRQRTETKTEEETETETETEAETGRLRGRSYSCIYCRMVVCVLDRGRVMVFDTATTTHKISWT